MQRWQGRVAVVTGASAGIGADIVKQLACNGLVVVGLARRKEKVEALATEVGNKGKIHAVKCNISDEKDAAQAFEWIEKNLGGISVLINNAGLSRNVNFKGKGEIKGWKEILDTNIYGLSICTRYALQNMIKHNIDDGQFININSVAGHNRVPELWADSTMYYASKHAVRILTDALRKEVNGLKKQIRVTNLSPGLVRTEFFEAIGDKDLNPDEILNTMPCLDAEHITQGVIYVLSTPPIVNISELTIQPIGEAL